MSEQPVQSNQPHPAEGTRFDNDNVIDFRMARDGLASQSLIEAQRQVERSYGLHSTEKYAEVESEVVQVHRLLIEINRIRQERMAG